MRHESDEHEPESSDLVRPWQRHFLTETETKVAAQQAAPWEEVAAQQAATWAWKLVKQAATWAQEPIHEHEHPRGDIAHALVP